MNYKIEIKISRIRVYLCVLLIILAGGLYYVIGLNHSASVRQIVLTQQLDTAKRMNELLTDRINKKRILIKLKGTRMEEAIICIERASNRYDIPVEVFMGIASAESSFKYFKCYNPWGIGNNGPRCYDNWEHSVNDFGRVIRKYYFNEGLDTPEKILMKYVGWENLHWIRNVKEYWRS